MKIEVYPAAGGFVVAEHVGAALKRTTLKTSDDALKYAVALLRRDLEPGKVAA